MRHLIILGLLGLGLVACGEKKTTNEAVDKTASADVAASLQQWLSKAAQPISTLDAAQSADQQDLNAMFADSGG